MDTVYASVDNLIARMDASSATTFNAAELVALTDSLRGASRAVDGVCRRSFGQSASGTVRYYTPIDGMRLRVHDLVSVSALATDEDGDLVYETTWAAADYHLLPVDAQDEAGELLRPYTEITMSLATGSAKRGFPVGYARSVKVTGVWGWPAVPDVVREVTVLEALRMFQQAQAPSGIIANTAGGGMTVTPAMHPTSKLMLQPYIRMARGLR